MKPKQSLWLLAEKNLKTVKDFVRFGATTFNKADLWYGHGMDNGWDEALALVLFALNLSYEIADKMSDANLIPSEKKAILTLFRKRVEKRIPVPYLTHKAFFAGLEFYVDERVLIPRSPLAECIEKGFSPWLDKHPVTRILEIGTGSGCIAIACAHFFEEAEVDATDLSKEALVVAKQNVVEHDLEDRIHLFKADLFPGKPEGNYDLIISNPPYVSKQEWESLPAEYHHEPVMALVSKKDGVEIVERILKQAARYLKPNGILVVEVGNTVSALIEHFPHIPFTWLEFERGGEGVFVLTQKQLSLVLM